MASQRPSNTMGPVTKTNAVSLAHSMIPRRISAAGAQAQPTPTFVKTNLLSRELALAQYNRDLAEHQQTAVETVTTTADSGGSSSSGAEKENRPIATAIDANHEEVMSPSSSSSSAGSSKTFTLSNKQAAAAAAGDNQTMALRKGPASPSSPLSVMPSLTEEGSMVRPPSGTAMSNNNSNNNNNSKINSSSSVSPASSTAVDSSHVRVYCRFRPFLDTEIAQGVESVKYKCHPTVVRMAGDPNAKRGGGTGVANQEREFSFERCFDEQASQEQVYECVAKPLLSKLFQGSNASVIVYGHTGVGKTYTMEGVSTPSSSTIGLVPRLLEDMFARLHRQQQQQQQLADDALTEEDDSVVDASSSSNSSSTSSSSSSRSSRTESSAVATVTVSYFEVYNGKIRDLLDLEDGGVASRTQFSSRPKIELVQGKRDYVQIAGLIEKIVENTEDAMAIFNLGKSRRTSAPTNANLHSSRSHSVFSVSLAQPTTMHATSPSSSSISPSSSSISPSSSSVIRGASSHITTSVMRLVDLAGSEQAESTGLDRQRLLEARSINTSLLCLSNVITALAASSSPSSSTGDLASSPAIHIGYRDSILTRVLQQSLGGNSCTSLLIACTASLPHCSKTINALRFGQVCRTVTNRVAAPSASSSMSRKHLLQLLEAREQEIERLLWQITRLGESKLEAQAEEKQLKAEQEQAQARERLLLQRVAAQRTAARNNHDNNNTYNQQEQQVEQEQEQAVVSSTPATEQQPAEEKAATVITGASNSKKVDQHEREWEMLMIVARERIEELERQHQEATLQLQQADTRSSSSSSSSSSAFSGRVSPVKEGRTTSHEVKWSQPERQLQQLQQLQEQEDIKVTRMNDEGFSTSPWSESETGSMQSLHSLPQSNHSNRNGISTIAMMNRTFRCLTMDEEEDDVDELSNDDDGLDSFDEETELLDDGFMDDVNAVEERDERRNDLVAAVANPVQTVEQGQQTTESAESCEQERFEQEERMKENEERVNELEECVAARDALINELNGQVQRQSAVETQQYMENTSLAAELEGIFLLKQKYLKENRAMKKQLKTMGDEHLQAVTLLEARITELNQEKSEQARALAETKTHATELQTELLRVVEEKTTLAGCLQVEQQEKKEKEEKKECERTIQLAADEVVAVSTKVAKAMVEKFTSEKTELAEALEVKTQRLAVVEGELKETKEEMKESKERKTAERNEEEKERKKEKEEEELRWAARERTLLKTLQEKERNEKERNEKAKEKEEKGKESLAGLMRANAALSGQILQLQQQQQAAARLVVATPTPTAAVAVGSVGSSSVSVWQEQAEKVKASLVAVTNANRELVCDKEGLSLSLTRLEAKLAVEEGRMKAMVGEAKKQVAALQCEKEALQHEQTRTLAELTHLHHVLEKREEGREAEEREKEKRKKEWRDMQGEVEALRQELFQLTQQMSSSEEEEKTKRLAQQEREQFWHSKEKEMRKEKEQEQSEQAELRKRWAAERALLVQQTVTAKNKAEEAKKKEEEIKLAWKQQVEIRDLKQRQREEERAAEQMHREQQRAQEEKEEREAREKERETAWQMERLQLRALLKEAKRERDGAREDRENSQRIIALAGIRVNAMEQELTEARTAFDRVSRVLQVKQEGRKQEERAAHHHQEDEKQVKQEKKEEKTHGETALVPLLSPINGAKIVSSSSSSSAAAVVKPLVFVENIGEEELFCSPRERVANGMSNGSPSRCAMVVLQASSPTQRRNGRDRRERGQTKGQQPVTNPLLLASPRAELNSKSSPINRREKTNSTTVVMTSPGSPNRRDKATIASSCQGVGVGGNLAAFVSGGPASPRSPR